MLASDIDEIRDHRSKMLLALEEMEKTMSDELSQISARKRELELQIDLTQKRLQQQMTALRSQVRSNAKAAQHAEDKYRKAQKEKSKKPRKSGSTPALDDRPNNNSSSQPDARPEYTRASLAQLFAERTAEREAQLLAHVAAREHFLLSSLSDDGHFIDNDEEEEEEAADQPLPVAADSIVQAAGVQISAAQAERLACLVQFRISEFTPPPNPVLGGHCEHGAEQSEQE